MMQSSDRRFSKSSRSPSPAPNPRLTHPPVTSRLRHPLNRARNHRLWAQADLLKTLIQRDLEARYKGSLLGRFWVVLNQVAQLLVYTFAFSIVLKTRPPELNAFPKLEPSVAYGLWVFSGLIPWTAFILGVNQGATSVLSQPNLVKKVIFPLALLPLVPVGAAFMESSLGLMLLLTAIVVAAKTLPLTIALLPLVWVPQFLLTAGLSYLTAGLTVYLRDIPQTLMVITNLLFYLTPIVYSTSVLPGDWKNWIFWLNPMATIVQIYRELLGFRDCATTTVNNHTICQTILVDNLPQTVKAPIHWGEFGIATLVSAVVCLLGLSVYQRLRRGFADVL
jgi:lipopolysaccharide transport system permease protein